MLTLLIKLLMLLWCFIIHESYLCILMDLIVIASITSQNRPRKRGWKEQYKWHVEFKNLWHLKSVTLDHVLNIPLSLNFLIQKMGILILTLWSDWLIGSEELFLKPRHSWVLNIHNSISLFNLITKDKGLQWWY